MFFAECSEGQIVTCPRAFGGCHTKMCHTQVIQCQQKFYPCVMHQQRAWVFPSWARMPVFWDTLPPHDYPYYPDNKVHGANMGPIWGRQGPGGPHVGPMNFAAWVVIHIRSQVKTRQSQRYKFKKNAKKSNFQTSQETSHMTHLLKLLDKMYKYEMDPTRTVGATERTPDAGRTSLSMNKPTTWCKSGRVSLVSSSCLYKTQPERALAQVCHTRIEELSPDEYQFHLLLHWNSLHSQATYPKWLNH